jgi:hypothetical protein
MKDTIFIFSLLKNEYIKIIRNNFVLSVLRKTNIKVLNDKNE